MIVLSPELVARAVEGGGYDLATDAELFNPAFRDPIVGRGFMTRDQLLAIGRWKAVRATGRMATADEDVRRITELAFQQNDPWLANWILRSMSGVGTPMASAILTVFDETRFTVIDVRAINTLRLVDLKSLDLDRPDWLDSRTATQSSWVYGQYVRLCIDVARSLDVTLRSLDRCLWALNGQN